jgi:hypothetical protein
MYCRWLADFGPLSLLRLSLRRYSFSNLENRGSCFTPDNRLITVYAQLSSIYHLSAPISNNFFGSVTCYRRLRQLLRPAADAAAPKTSIVPRIRWGNCLQQQPEKTVPATFGARTTRSPTRIDKNCCQPSGFCPFRRRHEKSRALYIRPRTPSSLSSNALAELSFKLIDRLSWRPNRTGVQR